VAHSFSPSTYLKSLLCLLSSPLRDRLPTAWQCV
jgi:hypothetical protein